MTTERVGFIGLGNMGGRMSRALVRGGVDVLGFDAKPGAAEAAHATPARSVTEVVESVDIILMSLPTSAIVEKVVLDESGLLSASRPGQIVVDLSTSAPMSTRKLASQAAELGVSYIDAGISGGAAAAEAGKLTLMLGGEAAAIERLQPVFKCIATKVFPVGGSGNGHTAKLLNNFLNAVSLAATAEVMVAAKKSDLDLSVLLDVINNSSGVSFASINRFPNIIRGDYMEGGLSSALMTKDILLYLEHVGAVGVSSLNAAGPLASFGLAHALGYGDQISNHVVDAIGDVSGGVRLCASSQGEEPA